MLAAIFSLIGAISLVGRRGDNIWGVPAADWWETMGSTLPDN